MSESGVPGNTLAIVEEEEQQGGTRPHGPQHGTAASLDARRPAPTSRARWRERPPVASRISDSCTPASKSNARCLTYQKAVTLTDRVDYLAPLSNNLCYCLAAEKLLQLEIPAQAQWMRVNAHRVDAPQQPLGVARHARH